MNNFIRKYLHISFMVIAASVILYACGNNQSYDNAELARINQMYEQAAQAQKSGDNARAKTLYDQLLHYRPKANVCIDSLMPIASKTITQTMNNMQSMGEQDECVGYLRRLRESDSLIVGNRCKRDISVVLAYAMSRTEDLKGAAHEMDEAMNMPPQLPTHDRLFRDYAFATAVYFCLPEREDDVYRYGKMALDEIAKCGNKSGESWLMAVLGMAYTRSGNLNNAISMFKQSYKNALLRDDSLSMANTLCFTAEIMVNWRLFGYANDFASKAVEISRNVRGRNPKISSNILAQKALVMLRFGYADSARMYLAQAEEYAKNLSYNSGRSDIDLIRGELLAKNKSTHQEGMQILYKVARDGTSGLKTKAYFVLAQEHITHGEILKGEAAVDSAITAMSINTSPILRTAIYEFALDYYVTTDNHPKMVWIAREMNNKNLSMVSNSNLLKQYAMSIVDFNVQDGNGEIDWQEMRVEHSKNVALIYVIVLMVVFVCIVLTLLAMRYNFVLRRRFCDQQLESLAYKMEIAPSLTVQKYTSGMAKSRKAQADKKYGEKCFYNSFQQLHPHFLANLRSIAPSISRHEELLAMLVALQVDRHQVEDIMCMTRSRMAKTRYNLRRKIRLNRKDSLEYAIVKILNKQQHII